MNYIIAIVSVLIYGVIIWWLIKSRPKTTLLLPLLCVFFGILSAMISLGLEFLWNYFLGSFIGSHHSLIFVESFFGVALLEEGSKWIWLVFIISRWKNFNLYTHGILYACGIAAGFNLVEGILYATIETDALNMVLRSFTAVPVHFLFAIVMGFLFARYKIEGNRFFWFSLLIPVILHGLYDFFILQQYADLLTGAALLVLIGCLCLSVWVVNIALKADKLRIIYLDRAGEV
ncbi:MAG TPA: PrsW family glutamic-type intramembrane protease [Saprospiraceae bacterium]|nr:PrsW family glutamic-type intramembrane protease [Saprospiraceae bacterium]